MNSKNEKCSVLITGATGFIGTALIKRLLRETTSLTAAVLAGMNAEHLPATVERVYVDPLSESCDYLTALQNVDIVIHLAARVHVMKETAKDPLEEFRRVNVRGTERLARQAVQAGVKRFVFMSTIGVNGHNSGEKSYTERDYPHPHNPYSTSKYEAELVLQRISQETGIEVVIIRAPIVYGPGNPGNFLSLLRIVSKGIPLPLASIINRRSLIYVGNLVDILAICATHPAASGNTFLVSDGEDVSTPELVQRIAKALGVKVSLLQFPLRLLQLIGKLTGTSSTLNRLTGSLAVDSSKIRQELGWVPPFSMEEGLRETAESFQKKR